MAEKKNRVIMKINGQEYPIAANESKEYLIRIGTFVDDKMQEIAVHNRQLSLSMVAVLTSINIADLYLKSQQENTPLNEQKPLKNEDVHQMKSDLEKKSQSLSQEKEHSRNLQQKLSEARKENERKQGEMKKLQENLNKKDQELNKANGVIKELQDQLYESQLQVVELQQSDKD